MAGEIPKGMFRFEPGYTFEQALNPPELCQDNILVGGVPGGEQSQAFFLGKVAEYQLMKTNIWLDCRGAHAVYVMGKRRSGKTYTLGVIVEGLLSQSWVHQGLEQQAVLVIDTMNIFTTMPHSIPEVYGKDSKLSEELQRWGLSAEEYNVVLFTPRGCAQPPEGKIGEVAIRPCDLSSEDWVTLFEVDSYSDPIGQLVSEIYDKVAVEGYTNQDGNHVHPNSEYSIEDLLECLQHATDIAPPRYEQRTIEAVRRRLNAVRRLPIFSASAINIADYFKPGQASVLLLRDLDHSIRALLVGVLIKKIMQLRSISDKYERLAAVHNARTLTLQATDPPEAQKADKKYKSYKEEAARGLPRGWVIIDEAHNYLPSRGIVASSAPLKKYVNEGRNLGLSIVVATQNPSGLDPAIRRNADVLVIHSISMRDDVAAAEGMVNTFIPDSFMFGRNKVDTRVFEQLLRSLPQGYAVLSNDRLNRISVVKIRPRITVHGGIEY